MQTMLNSVIFSDVFPVNLEYDSDLAKFFRYLRMHYNYLFLELIEFHKLLYKELIDFLYEVHGRPREDLPLHVNMGSLSTYMEKQWLNLRPNGQDVLQLVHTCALIHIRSVGRYRLLNSSTVWSIMLSHVAKRVIIDQYIPAFISKNKDILRRAWERFLKICRQGGMSEVGVWGEV
jgi:hypothetical protein